MDFSYTAHDDAFRQELRAWLQTNLREHRAAWGEDKDEFTQHPSSQASIAWHQRLHAGGWVGLHWPREYGGRGATLMEQVMFTEECMRVGAPPGVNGIGINMVGPMLMHYGTAAQKSEHLAKILSADESWCQGFSEPGSGSDLASLTTRAVQDGDDFVVNGAKIWTSNAHNADRCILLVRTDADAPKHKGMSCLLGPYGQLWEDSLHAVDDGYWAFQTLFSRRYGIAGGTDEIQKNIIGERQLGLPK